MFEWNLNLFVTFFWLSLSAGMILSGIWLLIDCKINHSLINIILQRYNYPVEKLTNQNDLSKTYFLHFYVIALFINLILFVLHLSSFLLFILFLLHILRRLYECLYIHKSHTNTKINYFYYFLRLIHYPCVGFTIIIDYKYPYTNITIWKYLFALILFFNASYIQYNVHVTWTQLNRSSNEIYPISNGSCIFKYFSCPNYLAEIVIYTSFFITSHRTSAMAALLVWVLVNQTFSVLLNHRWFGRYDKDRYPTNRCALVPFIL